MPMLVILQNMNQVCISLQHHCALSYSVQDMAKFITYSNNITRGGHTVRTHRANCSASGRTVVGDLLMCENVDLTGQKYNHLVQRSTGYQLSSL